MSAYKDLTGHQYGRLTVLCDSGRRTCDGNTIWHCRCECGNELDVRGNSLTGGNTKSCGCLNRERHSAPRRDLVDGTSLSAISSTVVPITNTTGVKGVTYFKPRGKYHAYIGFKGVTYSLGYYDTLEEAAAARKAAEIEFYHDMLQNKNGEDN